MGLDVQASSGADPPARQTRQAPLRGSIPRRRSVPSYPFAYIAIAQAPTWRHHPDPNRTPSVTVAPRP